MTVRFSQQPDTARDDRLMSIIDSALPPSLRHLMKMSLRARVFRIGRMFRSVKGAVTGTIIGFFLLMWIAGTLIGQRDLGISPTTAEPFVRMGLFAFWLLTMLSGHEEGGIPFSPAETQFLFSGPFTRGQLLTYRISSSVLATIPAAFIFAMFSARQAPSVLFWVPGLLLSLIMLNISQLMSMQLKALLDSALVARGRKVITFVMLLSVIGLIAISVLSNSDVSFLERARNIVSSPWAEIVTAPFAVFARAMTATTAAVFFMNGGLGCGLIALLVFGIYRLDNNLLESSLAASERLEALREQARQGKMPIRSHSIKVGVRRSRMLPRLGGFGPLAWRQALSLKRSGKTVFVSIAVFTLFMVGPSLFADRAAIGSLPTACVMMFFIIPQMVRFDFRNDVDYIGVLKSLPLRPLPIVLGQLAVPVALLTGVASGLVLLLAGISDVPRRFIVAGLIAIPPLALMSFAIENAVFLFYPYRLQSGRGFDLSMVMRQTAGLLGRMIMLGICGMIAGGIGGLAWVLSGKSIPIALIVGTLTLWPLSLLPLPIICFALQKFDPAEKVPD